MPEDEYLAQPSGDCCTKGTLHSGEARGALERIADIETYVSRPSQGRANGHVLLYFPDVWGMWKNSHLIMDGFADAGYLTLGIDYFRGDPIWAHRKNGEDTDADFDFAAWRQKHWDFAQIAVPKWVAAVKAQYGEASTKYAAVGYCFGAPYVCDLLAAEDVTAGAFAHPSFLKESHFHQIKRPLFMSCAEIDPYFDQSSRRRALEILQEEKKKKWHLQLFCNVEHGFAVRGDPEIPHIRWSKEQSHRSIVSWFDLWLSQ